MDLPPARVIGTHDGAFHADEALACYMLRNGVREFRGARVVRTRDPEKLKLCDIVVDVGGVFSHESKRYDHHQRDFNQSYNSLDPSKPWITKLSSAGLVYVYYCREVIGTFVSEVVTENKLDYNPAADESLLTEICNQLYENFIEEIDAVDNGIAVTDGTPRYLVTTTISKRVASLIPMWNAASSDEILYAQFEKAMELMGSELRDRVRYYVLSWLPAHQIVYYSVKDRTRVHHSGEIIRLDKGNVPWKDHIYSVEQWLGIASGTIKYVLYFDGSKWRAQCVPVRVGSFESRVPFPEPWRGLRDEQLTQVAGIAECVFVHANGFIGGNSTYQGALQMAEKSLLLSRQ